MPKKLQPNRIFTPLGVIGAFLSLTEIVAGIAAAKTTGYVQGGLTIFVCVFPVMVLGGFFSILWAKPHVFYPPADFGSRQDVRQYVEAMQGRLEASGPTAAEPKKTDADTATLPAEQPDRESKQEEDSVKGSLQPTLPAGSEETPTSDELQMEMLMAFLNHHIDDAEKTFAKLMHIEQDVSRKRDHEVWHAYLQFTHAHQTAGFNELLRLSNQPETQSQACFYLGLSYQRLKEFEKAIKSLRTSFDTATVSLKPYRIVSLAEAYVAAGQPEIAISTLIEALENVSDSDQSILYRGLADAFEKTANHELRALALELAIDAKPQDTDSRFTAAYAYSQHGLRDMAVIHYTAHIAAKPEAVGALNNLGVAYENLGMPIAAVNYYRRSFKLKHGLAGANLAYQFLDGGFHDEAKTILEEVKGYEDLHPNVGSALAALTQRREKEDRQKNEILQRAQREQAFLKSYAKRYFRRSEDAFVGQWQWDNGETLSIAKANSKLKAEWVHDKRKKELTGIVTNQTAKIRVTSRLEEPTLLLADTKEFSAYAITSDDGREMEWMWFDNELPIFARLVRVASST